MPLYQPVGLEPPDDAEFYAWYEHSERCGDLAEWAQDWAATVDAENYPAGKLRDAIEEMLALMVDVYETTPDFADRYKDRAA